MIAGVEQVFRRTATAVLVVAALTAGAGVAHAAQTPGFSHAVVVDQQRPGFEPDVKVDGNGAVYTSVPFGFSTTQSFVWSSRDTGRSYQFTPGNTGVGKPNTCVGGGDTDLYLDAHNALYFSDLQGLTNITNSKSTDGGATWTTNCAGAPNTPDDRMWFAGTGSSAGGDLTLYQDYDAVNSSASGGNQLVETVSRDGTTFTPVVNLGAGVDCAGAALYNCVTNNEGISGNQVVDPSTGNVFIAHTTTNGSSGTPGVQVSEGKITPGTPTTATWTESPNLDASLCPDATCVDAAGNPEELAGENFASLARDAAGYLYVTFTAGSLDHASSADPNFGGLTAPEQIYVVHSLQPAGANPATLTWSAPQRISGAGASAGTNTFPWITAGSDGRVDVAWYHASQTSQAGPCASGSGTCTLYGAANLTNAEWSVQLGQSLNAHDASPAYSTTSVSETYIKHGQICTNGLGCATGGDRSLGDFLQVSIDNQGAAVVSSVFDTSADTSAGEDTGPEVITRQTSGPSLFASAGTVNQGNGPGVDMGSISDPTGDADYSANGTRTSAPAALDLTGASLANGPGATLIATIKASSLKSLAAPASVGGPDASWLIRWTEVVPGTTGNGHIYYAGMDSNQGAGGSGTPTFFAGDTAGLPPANAGEHTKYMTFPQTHALSASAASYNATTGVITLRIPRSLVGNPPDGTVLFSGTAFSATSATPQSAATLFNLIDATSPFELVVGAPGTVGTSPTSPGRGTVGGGSGGTGGTGGKGARCQAPSGRLTGRRLGPLALGMTRSRARHLLSHFTTRRKLAMDFYCQRSNDGIRAFYPTDKLLRTLPRGQRGAHRGRIMVALTAGRRYALHGVRTGSKLAKVRRRLRVGRAYHVGKNVWYVTPNGPSRGVLKVRNGVIQEIGIASKRFTGTVAARRRFLRLLL
jgi:hypothetical protein